MTRKSKPAPKKAQAPAKKNKGGRPSLYRGEETIAEVTAMILLGFTHEQIAEDLGVNVSTLYDWKAEYPEFSEALSRARRKRSLRVVNSLLQRAEGGLVKEEKAIKVKTKGGETVKVVAVETYIPPDTAAIIYWLNNRERDNWKLYKAHEHSGPGGGPVQHEHTLPADVLEAVKRITEGLK